MEETPTPNTEPTEGPATIEGTQPDGQAHPFATKVVMATLSGEHVDTRFFYSWDEARDYDLFHCQHLLLGSVKIQTGPRLPRARTQIVEAFLTSPAYAGAEWLLCVDSDMTFPPDAVCTLLEAAYSGPDGPHPHKMIMGGLCFAGGASRQYPTIYEPVPSDYGLLPQVVDDFPENALLKVYATGGAALLIHRKVLVHMAAPHPHGFGTHPDGRPNRYPWFFEGLFDVSGDEVGEDIAFCMRASGLGYPVWVYTGIEFGHRKMSELNSKTWRDYKGTLAPSVGALPDLAASKLTLPGDDGFLADRLALADQGRR